jgi:hypothetical protein
MNMNMHKQDRIYEIDEGVFYHTVGEGHFGMMYHRDINWSFIAVIEDPEVDLLLCRILDDDEFEIVRKEILNIENDLKKGDQ